MRSILLITYLPVRLALVIADFWAELRTFDPPGVLRLRNNCVLERGTLGSAFNDVADVSNVNDVWIRN